MARAFLLWLSLLMTLVAAQLKCYRIDGSEADSVYAPCNPNAKVSGCCAINKTNPDLCLGSGLCMSQDEGYQGFIYANGCTDKTGKDSACPNPCPNSNWGGSNAVTAYNVLQCAPQSQYCCRKFGDSNNCCSSTVSFKIGSIMTTATTTGSSSSVSATTTSSTTSTAVTAVCAASGINNSSNECPQDKSAVVGGAVGGVLGAALLASLGALVFLLLRRRKDPELVSAPTYQQQQIRQPPVYELPPGTKLPEMAG